jgi:excisionase family DNA binding protein
MVEAARMKQPLKLVRPPQPPSEIPRLLTLAQVAEHLDVCIRTLRRAIDRGDIRVVKLGRVIRVSEDELRRIVAEGF